MTDLVNSKIATERAHEVWDGLESALTSAIFNAAVDAIMVIDSRGILKAANKSAERLFGFSEDEMLGQNVSILMPAPYAQQHDTYLNNYCTGGERKIIGIGREVMGRHKDGSSFPLHLSVGEFLQGDQRLFVGICHDISERRQFTEHIAFLAKYDGLTGCANRREFIEGLSKAIESCDINERKIAVLFIDLDGFKQINDNHGHRVGDRLLKLTAERFQKILRDTDLLGRVGGDEFVVSIVIDSKIETASEIAKRLLETLREPFVIDNRALTVSASIGISLFPDDGITADEVINEADIAMYQAKVEGGNCIRLFDQALRDRSEQIYRVLSRLRKAIPLEQFELHYQLQFDLQTMQPCGIEALLRWRDGKNGLVPPDQFIPIALEHGLMPTIGRWVIHQACKDNIALIKSDLLDVTVAVNICAPLFSEPGFCTLVSQTLMKTGLPANRLELEITEDVAMNSSAQVLQAANELHRAGISLAMDDFGVGFSSLDRLKKLRFDKLKIDRSFVSGLPESTSDQAIVKAVLGMAEGLGMITIAEGIESSEQISFLQEAGCAQGQGFIFAKPMPLKDLIEWLRARK
ncbi:MULTISPECIES: putative bifunctional diguanylate cyclase/phosphodiesterase [Pseudomonas]|uniref:putative bifunctional diguanylate cyclase/phosphodiesterase n=1 Tax=Pseudomonas TaxID=286 RepID=UPI0008E34FA1|nr:GGDEF domain-containing phosphodiesterase [Pseudomonas marincola]MAB99768.1 phosphodiesterase [Pseudomonadaceae bacterium]SFU12569.1 PAS domain S-box-containing protein/diguanylate cyclase (GGDEF) domain-containing protein [Pseudomonas marincola]